MGVHVQFTAMAELDNMIEEDPDLTKSEKNIWQMLLFVLDNDQTSEILALVKEHPESLRPLTDNLTQKAVAIHQQDTAAFQHILEQEKR